VPLTEEEEELEVKNTIQQTVSHFTSNTNKVRTLTYEHIMEYSTTGYTADRLIHKQNKKLMKYYGWRNLPAHSQN
jgi:hypothetical protein